MDDDKPLPVQLRGLIAGKWVSKAIAVAADLGIADLLKDGALPSDEIARETRTSPDGVYRLMRALGNVGVLVEHEGRRFALSEMGQLLRRDVPGSMRGFARFVGHESTWRPWRDLLGSVQTGEPAFDRAYGHNFFEHVQRDAEAAEVFDEAMTSISTLDSDAIAATYDFAGIGTLADVGGGHGRLLATILEANPKMRGILLEMPHVLEGARRDLARHGVLERCTLVGGSFFEDAVEGADAVVLKHILHDWDDESCRRILAPVHRALPPNGRLLVAEAVIPPPGEPHFGKILDLEMLVLTPRGRERTEREFAALFESAGFRLTRVIPTPASVWVVEGVKV